MFNYDSESTLFSQTTVSRTLETYLRQGRSGADAFIPGTLTALLMALADELKRTLAVKAASVKRLFALREALPQLDWGDESSLWMRQELARVCVTPSFLKPVEGRRVLAKLLWIDPSLTMSLHAAVRPFLASGRAGLLELLGDVYFRAWSDSAADPRAPPAAVQALERSLQEVMEQSLVGARPATVKSVLVFLQAGFFERKRSHPAVDELLDRLYGPLLWRTLSAANPQARMNAITVLTLAFPLQPSSRADLAALEALLTRQVTALEQALDDEDAVVRAHAVKRVCGALARWWEVLVESAAKRLAAKVVVECCFDSASVSVRAAALSGLAVLLDNPLSHPLLQLLLPRLAPLVHDNAERVQTALLQLLLSVKRLRVIRFYDVVPQEELLLRLSVTGAPAVRALIAELLANTYFPTDKPNNELVERALVLIREHPAAARGFFSAAHGLRGDAQALKLACMLYKAALYNAKFHLAQRDGDDSVPAAPSALALDADQVAATLLVICDLWRAAASYDSDPALAAFTHKFFADGALDVLPRAYPHSQPVVAAALVIASRLPPAMAPSLVTHVLSLPRDERAAALPALQDCLARWGHAENTAHAAALVVARALVAAAPDARPRVLQALRGAGVDLDAGELALRSPSPATAALAQLPLDAALTLAAELHAADADPVHALFRALATLAVTVAREAVQAGLPLPEPLVDCVFQLARAQVHVAHRCRQHLVLANAAEAPARELAACWELLALVLDMAGEALDVLVSAEDDEAYVAYHICTPSSFHVMHC
jgi:hypothetical protein